MTNSYDPLSPMSQDFRDDYEAKLDAAPAHAPMPEEPLCGLFCGREVVFRDDYNTLRQWAIAEHEAKEVAQRAYGAVCVALMNAGVKEFGSALDAIEIIRKRAESAEADNKRLREELERVARAYHHEMHFSNAWPDFEDCRSPVCSEARAAKERPDA